MARDTNSTSNELLWFWNVVERSKGGHERRRRLEWPMTDAQAGAWARTREVRLERVAPAAELGTPGIAVQQEADGSVSPQRRSTRGGG